MAFDLERFRAALTAWWGIGVKGDSFGAQLIDLANEVHSHSGALTSLSEKGDYLGRNVPDIHAFTLLGERVRVLEELVRQLDHARTHPAQTATQGERVEGMQPEGLRFHPVGPDAHIIDGLQGAVQNVILKMRQLERGLANSGERDSAVNLAINRRLDNLERSVYSARAQINANDVQHTALAKRFSAHLTVHCEKPDIEALAHRLTRLEKLVTEPPQPFLHEPTVFGQGKPAFNAMEQSRQETITPIDLELLKPLPLPLPKWEACFVARSQNAWIVSGSNGFHVSGCYAFDDMDSAGRFIHTVLTQPKDAT
jgi:hypothetical protein